MIKHLPFKKNLFFWLSKYSVYFTPFFYVLGNGYNLFKLAGVPFFQGGEKHSLGIIFSFASQMVLNQGILKLGI